MLEATWSAGHDCVYSLNHGTRCRPNHQNAPAMCASVGICHRELPIRTPSMVLHHLAHSYILVTHLEISRSAALHILA